MELATRTATEADAGKLGELESRRQQYLLNTYLVKPKLQAQPQSPARVTAGKDA